jgi:hypothetical protein
MNASFGYEQSIKLAPQSTPTCFAAQQSKAADSRP